MLGADLHCDADEYGRARVDELVDLGCGRQHRVIVWPCVCGLSEFICPPTHLNQVIGLVMSVLAEQATVCSRLDRPARSVMIIA